MAEMKDAEVTMLTIMSDLHKSMNVLNANVAVIAENNKTISKTLEKINETAIKNKDDIKDIKTNQEIEKKKLLEYEARLLAVETTITFDKPLIEDIRGLRSRGIKFGAYIGGIFLALGIVTSEGQQFFISVFTKIADKVREML